jgi:hypothetical protein
MDGDYFSKYLGTWLEEYRDNSCLFFHVVAASTEYNVSNTR